ncbi:MAG: SatD family protein [Candidatus Cloacimonadota bacterium]|nr:SatD family protein [Candidatus Cloacimonadota bacterium]
MGKKEYFVITGDVVGSSLFKGEERKNLHNALVESLQFIKKEYADNFLYDFDIFRGDSFQNVLKSGSPVFSICLKLRLKLAIMMHPQSIDLRISIGYGTIDMLPEQRTSIGDGEAYRFSGEMLENLSKNKYRRIAMKISDAHLNNLLEGYCILFDKATVGWSFEQKEAVFWKMQGLTEVEIAQKVEGKPIAQQNVAKRLKSADWKQIVKPALNKAEDFLKNI